MDEKSYQRNMTNCQKKIRSDESDIGQQCQVTCGAEVVIGRVLPFMITAGMKNPKKDVVKFRLYPLC